MKYLLLCLALLGFGCQRPGTYVASNDQSATTIRSKDAPTVEPSKTETVTNSWSPSDESSHRLSSRLSEGRVRIQPVLLTKENTSALASNRWSLFSKRFPQALRLITLDPLILSLTSDHVHKGEAFPDTLNLSEVAKTIGSIGSDVLPVVYWDDDSLGVNEQYDRATGLFIRRNMSVMNEDGSDIGADEIVFLQWVAAVHE